MILDCNMHDEENAPKNVAPPGQEAEEEQRGMQVGGEQLRWHERGQ